MTNAIPRTRAVGKALPAAPHTRAPRMRSGGAATSLANAVSGDLVAVLSSSDEYITPALPRWLYKITRGLPGLPELGRADNVHEYSASRKPTRPSAVEVNGSENDLSCPGIEANTNAVTQCALSRAYPGARANSVYLLKWSYGDAMWAAEVSGRELRGVWSR
ncbi:hypothetical protein EDB85DRAFT_1890048 [Lactarius pseudohatsudake]|nr:hypothetical protein EDB85DRAFT_1890048 [Lactarius pseudohatsudake]